MPKPAPYHKKVMKAGKFSPAPGPEAAKRRAEAHNKAKGRKSVQLGKHTRKLMSQVDI